MGSSFCRVVFNVFGKQGVMGSIKSTVIGPIDGSFWVTVVQ
jgi:hypothetical protein